MIRLQVLGGLVVEAPDLSPGTRAQRRHPLALLALLAAAGRQGMPRDRIMGLLWPESDAERASNSLRQTMFWLRRDLDQEIFPPKTGSRIQLDPGRVSVDLWEFGDALKRGDEEEALDAYGGAFLDGVRVPGLAEFSHWVDVERARLERQHIAALDTLASQAEEERRYDDAVALRRRQATADPFSSRTALALLRAFSAAGDRPGALEHAAAYEHTVRQHLEAEPDPAVREYVAALREDPPGRPVQRRPERPSAAESPRPALKPADPEMAPEGTGPAGGGGRKRTTRLRPVLILAAALALAALATWAAVDGGAGGVGNPGGIVGDADGATAAPVATLSSAVVLGSGVAREAGRDPGTRLVACEGPACPDGALPQPSYVVPTHNSYTAPVPGTSFLSPVPDGVTLPAPGYPCCTTATFETDLVLPPEAETATLFISVLADNHATLALDDVEFGRHLDRDGANYSGAPATFATTVHPEPGRPHTLRLTLWNEGGAIALQYYAVATWPGDTAGATATDTLSGRR